MRSPYNFWFSKGSGAPQTICQQLAVQSLRKIHLALQSCTSCTECTKCSKNTGKHCICSVQTVQFETCDCHMVVTWHLLAEAGPLAGKVPGEPQRPQACWSRTSELRVCQTSELVASLRSLAVSSGLRKECHQCNALAGAAICCCFFLRFQTAKLLASGCR